MREIHVLTVSSSLPIGLLDELLTTTEALLHANGAARVWIDPGQPGISVLAEFAAADQPVADLDADESVAISSAR